MLEPLKAKFADLKYDWQHAPKRQRSSLVAIGLILACIPCAWFALAQIERDTLGVKNGNAFVETATEEEGRPGSAQGEKPESEAVGSGEDQPDGRQDAPAIDLAATEVRSHAAGCAPIDKLPRVAVAQSNRCEEAIQALLAAQFDGAAGAQVYLDESRGIALSSGETDKVAFTVQVVGAENRQLAQIDMTYAPATQGFGIVNAVRPAAPPEPEKGA